MTTPEDIAEKKWIATEREKIIAYLAHQGCRHAGVEEWPTFHVTPDLALWAIQSVRHDGRTGWWAISGDVPTDYVSSSLAELPQDALLHFSHQWKDVADHMRRGVEHPTLQMGTHSDWPELAEMLEHRATALRLYAEEEGWGD